ncbi:MAG: GNAT family N-acetyltransferase [Chloroflexota bacterium]
METNPFHFRPARLSDEAAVRQLSASIWDGHDYVPDCFADWVADPRGQFTVVYEGDRLVAFGKLSELGPGEGWLEGLRVAIEARGRGLGRLLHNYAVELADQLAMGKLRFATASDNQAVHKMAADTGFRLLGRHWLASAEAGAAMDEGGRVKDEEGLASPFILVTDLSAAQRWLEQSAVYQVGGGLAEDEWIWYEIRPRLAEWQQQGRLYWWTDVRRPAAGATHGRGLVIVHRTEPETLWVNLAAIEAAAWPALAVDLRGLAAHLTASRLETKPLAALTPVEALRAAGWQVEPDLQMWVFERTIGT